MSYCFTKKVKYSFEDTIAKATDELQKEGFGILTEIDVKATMKKKLDKDIEPYRILGACNPPYAYEAINAEPRIGVMLPCNVIVRQAEDDTVEVSAVDPVASMMAIKNESLGNVALEVRDKLERVIQNI